MTGNRSPAIKGSVCALVASVGLLTIWLRFTAGIDSNLRLFGHPLDPDVSKNIGFSTDLDGLPKLMKKLQEMPLQELERMEKQIRSLRASHFSYQISLFMKNEASDLQCQKVPTSPLGR